MVQVKPSGVVRGGWADKARKRVYMARDSTVARSNSPIRISAKDSCKAALLVDMGEPCREGDMVAGVVGSRLEAGKVFHCVG